jgi:hypothetical protein
MTYTYTKVCYKVCYKVVDVDDSSNARKISSNAGNVDVDPPASLEDSTGPKF